MDGVKRRVPIEPAVGEDGGEDGEPGRGTVRATDGVRPVDLHDRGRRESSEHAVEVGHPRPVEPFGVGRVGVQQGDGGLHLVRAERTPSGLREQRPRLRDRRGVPAATVLLAVGHEPAGAVLARRGPRVLEKQEGEQSRGLEILREKGRS